MKNSNQKGFTVIEGLLIIVAVTLIAFVGYYVWHTQKQTDKTLNQASSTSQKTATTASKTPVSSVKYLKITEWGVRIPYAGSDTYTYKSVYDNPDNASLADPNLISIVSLDLATKYQCTDGGAGMIHRNSPSDQVPSPTDVTVGESVTQAASQSPGTYIKVNGYYYSWSHDQSACSDNVTVSAQSQASTAFEGFFKKIQATPQ